MQETGETRNAILEEDNKLIQNIIDANKDKRDLYWIVIFAKPFKNCVNGKPTLVKHIKAYAQRPPSFVGGIIGEINNKEGSIKWEVNMPQCPFDFDALGKFGAQESDEIIIETTSIPGAYITK